MLNTMKQHQQLLQTINQCLNGQLRIKWQYLCSPTYYDPGMFTYLWDKSQQLSQHTFSFEYHLHTFTPRHAVRRPAQLPVGRCERGCGLGQSAVPGRIQEHSR